MVVNCAPTRQRRRAETNEVGRFRVNAVGPSILARRRNGSAQNWCNFTDYVFDGTAPDPYQEGPAQPAVGIWPTQTRWRMRAEAVVRALGRR